MVGSISVLSMQCFQHFRGQNNTPPPPPLCSNLTQNAHSWCTSIGLLKIRQDLIRSLMIVFQTTFFGGIDITTVANLEMASREVARAEKRISSNNENKKHSNSVLNLFPRQNNRFQYSSTFHFISSKWI